VGSLLLGLVTAIGWPVTIYRDALRASQLFVLAAAVETISLVAYVGLVLGLTFAGVELAVLIGASGTIPLFAGFGCAIAARLRRAPFRFRWRAVSGSLMREVAQLAIYVSFTEAAGTVVYALDRIVLGLFKSAATVGLYEGPVRAHNLVRALNAATSVTVLPTASRYVAAGDDRRMRELLVRGVRYTLGLTVPLTVTGMVLGGPILEVWLGPEFREGATAMAILLSYWLLNGCTGVLSGIIVATGRARTLAVYAWIVAPANLLMSVALTPSLGLEGVVIGTAVPYFVAFPFVMRVVLSEVAVPVGRLLRESFLPAYSLGLALTAALAIVRVAVSLDTIGTVVVTAALGIGVYWALFYGLFMSGAERRLVREIAGGAVTPRRLRRRPT
jgi:O-antigen/teichoic acid export membrane protein